jgi:hypothetical protein
LNFRVTVRDNKPYVAGSTIGQTAFTDVVVTVTNTAGPFVITAPNTNVTWAAGSTATVTWNVANTNTGSVNCATVNILLSTDGGQTFPTVLAAATANDGSQVVNVPNTPGNTNRIKVEAVGNIFFDISNTNFTIGQPAACGDPTGLNETAITTTSATIGWNAVSSALNYDVEYKVNSSSNWISAGNTSSTSVNLSGLSSSTLYDWRVRANCSGGAGNFVADQFTTAAVGGACPGPYDIEPNNSTGQSQQIPLNTDIKGTLGARNDNDYYKLVINTGGTITISLTTLPANYDLSLLNASGGVIATSASNGTSNETINTTVASGTTYYIRVYPRNNGAWNANSCYTLTAGGGTASREDGRWITDNGTKMSIFPNPAKGVLNVSIDDLQDNTTLKVYNVMGKLVMQQQVGKAVTQINIAKLPSGVYMLNVNDGNSVKSMKFVKE